MANVAEQYMKRCLALAALGAGNTAPNPMVGAVLVHHDRIIGEGYHKAYGEAHAEVNCLASVAEADQLLISQSTLYVSLEPCAHFGKTPPCADLIIRNQIPKVVIGCRDPFREVDGKGIDKLRHAGISVEVPVLEQECKAMNRRFFTFHLHRRPWIILKWAQSGDGKLANSDYSRVMISNAFTNRLVHKWRSEEAAILVGTNTALKDDPALTQRLWKGKSPIRVVIDMNLDLPETSLLLNREVPTIVFNAKKQEEQFNLSYYRLEKNPGWVQQVVHALYVLHVQSVIIEGGAKTLQAFIDKGLWDEARIIENAQLMIRDGIDAPRLREQEWVTEEILFSDTIRYYKKLNTQT